MHDTKERLSLLWNFALWKGHAPNDTANSSIDEKSRLHSSLTLPSRDGVTLPYDLP
jgi:hypothetical protein